jgi:Ca-activated chloride channel family protein
VGGATDIFTPLVRALTILSAVPNLEDYIPAIILMTDGEHNSGPDDDFFVKTYQKMRLDVPVFSILYGEASREQIDPIANLTRGRVFDGRTDLTKAFRAVRGYN